MADLAADHCALFLRMSRPRWMSVSSLVAFWRLKFDDGGAGSSAHRRGSGGALPDGEAAGQALATGQRSTAGARAGALDLLHGADGRCRRSWRGLALVNAVHSEQPRLSTPVIGWMSAELIQQLGGGVALPAEVCEQLIAKTDGVPLFIEEMTKTVLELGLLGEAQGNYVLAGPLPPMAVPSIAAIGAFVLMRCEGENAR